MKIERKFLEKWLDGLKTAWISKDIESAVRFFNKTTIYSEEPFSEEKHELKDIRELWKDIDKQDVYSLDFGIIAIDGAIAVIHYYFKYGNISKKAKIPFESDGIYIIRFDEDLNCIEFRQWWMMKG